MQIFVKSLEGKTLPLEIDPSSTVNDLLDQLSSIDDSFLEDGRIIYRGSVLEEDLELVDCELEDGSTLNFVVGLLGGAKKRKKKNYTTPKKNKHKKKKVKLAVLRYYKVDENGKITRLRRECEKCGAGVFMANHADRHYCGHCHASQLFAQEE